MGRVAQPTVAPCACAHTIRTLSEAVAKLQSELNFPDLRTKAGYRTLFVDYAEWAPRLVRYYRANRAAEHAVAAVCAIWLRMVSDAGLATKMRCDKTYDKCLLEIVGMRPACDLLILCTLRLVSTYAYTYKSDHKHYLTMELLHPLLDTVAWVNGRGLAGRQASEAFFRSLADVVRSDKAEKLLDRDDAAELLEKYIPMAGTLERDAFFTLFHVFGQQFRGSNFPWYPRELSSELGLFVLGMLRYGSVNYRRMAFSLLTGQQSMNPRKRSVPTEDCECCRKGTFTTEKTYKPRERMTSLFTLLPDVRAVLNSHGLEHCDAPQMERSALACRKIMHDLADTGDLAAAGLALHTLIARNPIAVPIEPCCSAFLGLADRSPRECGLEYDDWADTLLYAANAVRKLPQEDVDAFRESHPSRSPAYVAAVLESHHFLARDELSHALDLIKPLREEYPGDAYLLFVAFDAEQLDAVYERHEYESEALVTSIRKLLSAAAIDATTSLGRCVLSIVARNAFCFFNADYSCMNVSAWGPILDLADETAERYLKGSSPDAPDRCWMLEIRIITHVVRGGPDVARTLLDLVDMLVDWQQSSRLASALYSNARTLHLTDTVQYIVDNYTQTLIWEDRLSPYNPDAGLKEYTTRRSWLVPFYSQGQLTPTQWLGQVKSSKQAVDWNKMPYKVLKAIALPREPLDRMPHCETCGRQSASLKRCSGCRAVAYCNVDCQRTHWTGAVCTVQTEGKVLHCHRDECTRKYPLRSHSGESTCGPTLCFDC